MDEVKVSKFLSYILRHTPSAIGLELDAEGWADIEVLLRKANAHGQELTKEALLAVVASSDKKRFTISPDGTGIRAAQGHSLPEVDIQFQALTPPDVLYHGTAERFLAGITARGILPGQRQYVHLSAEKAVALETGKRYGRPVLLRIDAKRMHGAGFSFFRAENNVWLTKEVSPEFFVQES